MQSLQEDKKLKGLLMSEASALSLKTYFSFLFGGKVRNLAC